MSRKTQVRRVKQSKTVSKMHTALKTKTFILDTNIMLSDSDCLHAFQDNDVVVPLVALEELDRQKKRQDEIGRNARATSRRLDELRALGNLSQGVKLPAGGRLFVLPIAPHDHLVLPAELKDQTKVDNVIIAQAKLLADSLENGLERCILISKDINVRIKCDSLGIKCQDYFHMRIADDTSELYKGVKTLMVEDVVMADWYESREVYLDGEGLHPNEIVIMKSNIDSPAAIGRFIEEGQSIEKLFDHKDVFGLKPRNKEQVFSLNLLMDDDIKLVTLIGSSGVGKTLLALSAGLKKVLEEQKYERIIVTKPVQPVGKDIGFLPGTKEEKMDPWIAPIKDNLMFLFSHKKVKKDGQIHEFKRDPYVDKLINDGKIEVEAITYLRGRSLPNTFMIVDECFPSEQQVALANGGRISIGKLHAMNEAGLELPTVLSYNEATDAFEQKKILSTKCKGKRELFEISCANRKIRATGNHPFLTTNGWKKVSDLQPRDVLCSSPAVKHQILKELNDDQKQIVIGSLLGDGCIGSAGKNRYRVAIIHGEKQKEYCEWKASMFERTVGRIEKNGYSQKPAFAFQTKGFNFDVELPLGKKKELSLDIISMIDERALAIWFMDDGTVNHASRQACFCTNSFSQRTNELLVEHLRTRFGIDCKVHFNRYFDVRMGVKGYKRLMEVVTPFMHPNMAYKTSLSFSNQYSWSSSYKQRGNIQVDNIDRVDGLFDVFDIEVEGNHNFIAASQSSSTGPIVHNCQNLSMHELKTIITRVGDNTKIVLLGDIDQIDNIHVDTFTNGLTCAVEKFKDHAIAGHITLIKGERSPLASLASQIL